ncbi:hypothetical protein QJS04_geneDACA013381 [Acorus gramineus]|uniref:Uncharacterized protein n=1 Tax=Acorus gramineus TaxID=55184 RepID=A0AAV9A9S7_ACOGR|nr:hypothetical protein QJS04_geneDACA013381 [Acorus gramineus]
MEGGIRHASALLAQRYGKRWIWSMIPFVLSMNFKECGVGSKRGTTEDLGLWPKQHELVIFDYAQL